MPTPRLTPQMFIADPKTDRIRFTAEGVKQLGPYLARAGFNIRTIRTKQEAHDALEKCYARDLQALAHDCRGQDPELDRILSGLPGWE